MKGFVHPGREDLRIDSVLEALANPIRLRIVKRLAGGEELTCSTTLPDVSPSTASHHWRVLREGGVLWARREGRIILHTLRREDLDARFPGLLDSVLAAVDDSGSLTPALP
ncbi:ArsR/SmtB family transcription factor [Micromonospora sp. NPDC050784]|uniref:ArsR/SmtB family transcription factor n=1 Tax=Micromonospora sp. NPDC050784 TaxID=3364281 RepID=UPI0037A5D935